MKKFKIRQNESVLEYDDGDVIVAQGDGSREMFVIQHGEVSIIKRIGDQEFVLGTYGRGDFFGEMALIEGEPRSATVIAKGPVRLFSLHSGGFLLRIRRDPTFAFEVIRGLSKRVRRMDRAFSSLVESYDVPAKEIDEVLMQTEYDVPFNDGN